MSFKFAPFDPNTAPPRSHNPKFARPSTDGAHWKNVLEEVAYCASRWEPKVRLIGNVRAEDIKRAITEALEVAAKWEQCYQDRCENAYVEVSILKEVEKRDV